MHNIKNKRISVIKFIFLFSILIAFYNGGVGTDITLSNCSLFSLANKEKNSDKSSGASLACFLLMCCIMALTVLNSIFIVCGMNRKPKIKCTQLIVIPAKL